MKNMPYRSITSIALVSALLSISACAKSNAPVADKAAGPCDKYTDAKQKQTCLGAWKTGMELCKKEEIAYNKAKKDEKKKFNVEACAAKKLEISMKKAVPAK